MAKLFWKAGTMLAPLPPVLVSCGTPKQPNVMTAAWSGIVCTEPTLVYVSLRPSRYSHEIITKTEEFVINVPTAVLAKAVDFCGVKSGRQTDKFALCGLTAAPCEKISAPQIKESPISLECRVKKIMPLGSHDMFLAEVLGVDIDESLLDEKGALHLEKAGLLAYAHGFYYQLGKKIGKFGWSVEKNTTKKKRMIRERAEHQKAAEKKTPAKIIKTLRGKVSRRKNDR